MKKIGLFLGVVLLIAACNKNQRAANKLEGKWNVTAFYWTAAGEPESTTNELVVDNRTMSYNFQACDIKKDSECICEWQTVDGTGYETKYTWKYTVDDKGETLKIGYNLNDPEDHQVWTISTLSKKELEMTWISANGNTSKHILEKM